MLERAIWMAAGVALVLVAGCTKHMSYDQLDATRADASYALAKAEALDGRLRDVEGEVAELQAKLGE